MTKKVKKFYDDYDSIFIKPKYKNIQIKLSTVKNQDSIIKKISIPFIVISSVLVIYVFSSPIDKDDLSVSSDGATDSNGYDKERVEKYVFVYPFRHSKIRQVKESEVDLKNPLHLYLSENSLIVNDEYKFDILGKSEINSEAKKEWSILPDLLPYSSKESILFVQTYREDDYYKTLYFSIYANLVNSFELFLDLSNGSKVTIFEDSDINNIQNGYVLEYQRDIRGFIQNVIYQYFIFPDGTAILISTSTEKDVIKESKLKETMTTDTFEGLFKEELEFMRETVSFSKLN